MVLIENVDVSIASDDGSTFLVTLTASLAGALAGSLLTGFFAWLVFHHGVLEQRRTRLNEALGRLLVKINDDLVAYGRFQYEYDEASARYMGDPDALFEDIWDTHAPNSVSTSALATAMKLEAVGADLAPAKAVVLLVNGATSGSAKRRMEYLDNTVSLISNWRDGSIEPERVAAVAEKTAERLAREFR